MTGNIYIDSLIYGTWIAMAIDVPLLGLAGIFRKMASIKKID